MRLELRKYKEDETDKKVTALLANFRQTIWELDQYLYREEIERKFQEILKEIKDDRP
jgi:hypothetical protein